jgi:biopolymer transport protein ExbD
MIPGSSDRNLVTGINVTPLVDITLVLLIIFMVTATFISEQDLQVNLPKVVKEEKAPHPAMVVTMGAKGELKFNQLDTNLEALQKQMAAEVSSDPNLRIIIKADRSVPYDRLAAVLDAVKLGGVMKVALAMDRK